MSFEKLIRIPNDRIGSLIGKAGNVKSSIEKSCYVSIDVDGDTGEVFIKSTGDVEKMQPFKAIEIVTAIGRGFSPENAMTLLDGENTLHVIDLREFVGKSNANVERIKGRIIGEGGRARKNMENLTNTHISVYGRTVSIIGDSVTLKGWAIPSATDIAFSLGVLSLLGKRVPLSLKVFLTALAIIDDLGAIVIIAFFYSGEIQLFYLLLMSIAMLVLIFLNKLNVRNFIPYLIVGMFLWEFTHASGIHATISGVLLALTIPHKDKNNENYHKNSMLIKLEHAISPYVAFGIMPIFAFANAGVSLEGVNLPSILNPVPLGILCGLFFGKQLGVFLFSYLSIKFKFAEMPNNSNWTIFYGVGILTGIGFTMSLFVGNLAFAEATQHLDGVKIGVLLGSLASTLFGYTIILLNKKNKYEES